VLIHCAAAISRSTTVTISYVMATNKMTYMQASDYVKTKHPMTYPNEGFIEQLKKYELALCQSDDYSATDVMKSKTL
jgi:protein-tyrosine phosphatase